MVAKKECKEFTHFLRGCAKGGTFAPSKTEKTMKRIVISDESINSYGFWVLTAGIDTAAFQKNPVMLWNHNRDGHGTVNAQLPIGIWKDLRIENGVLTGEPVFDETDEFAVKIKKKYESGILNACSMGFIPLEWSDAPEMLKEGQTVATVTRCCLLEISICDIPANHNSTAALYNEDSDIVRLSELPVLLTKHNSTMNEQKQDQDPKGVTGNPGGNAPQGGSDNASIVAENATLREQLRQRDERDRTARKAEATSLLDNAVKSGRITAQARAQFEKLFEADHESAKAALMALPERQPLKTSNNAGGHGDRSGWTYLDWMKKDPDGLRKMKTDDPERFKELQLTLTTKH